jgi:ATP-binding protein involved in chromosome partitioning
VQPAREQRAPSDEPHVTGSASSTSAVEDLRARVGAVIDPEIRRPLADLGMIGEVSIVDDVAHVNVMLTITGCPAANQIEASVREAAIAGSGISRADVDVTVMSGEQRAALMERLRPGGKTMAFGAESGTRVIAVTSGKGGVGKSSVTVNLAVALAQRGLRVGILDADVYGYSIPSLMGLAPYGVSVRPTRIDEAIVPPVAHDVKVISIGMFVDDTDVAVAWRGPMLQRTVTQFLTDVYFGDLDVLLIDLPPGTGDVAITVGQLLPHADVLIVTTPQPYAAGVAVRAGSLAVQTGQRVIGVVENMSASVLPDGSTLDVFGSGGAQAVVSGLARQAVSTDILGHIPLTPLMAQAADTGIPLVASHPDDPAAQELSRVADALLKRTARENRTLPLAPR